MMTALAEMARQERETQAELERERRVEAECQEAARRDADDREGYDRYLAEWESWFGDADEGQYGYYRHGKHVPYTVHRLTFTEWRQHYTALDAAGKQFDAAEKAEDLAGMDAALMASLPHELALLV